MWIPEYPRGYLEAIGRKVQAHEFDHFARVDGQLYAAAVARLQRHQPDAKRGYIVQDTGPEVLRLWMEDKFGEVRAAVDDAYQARVPKMYVLCQPDLPWEYDPLREDPHRRQELFERLYDVLARRRSKLVEAAGFDESRYDMLRNVLRDLPAREHDET